MVIKGEPKIAASHVMKVLKVFHRERFLIALSSPRHNKEN